MRIFRLYEVISDFLTALFCANAKFGLPRKAGQTLIEFVRAATRFARGGFFYRKIRDDVFKFTKNIPGNKKIKVFSCHGLIRHAVGHGHRG
jgi:hypothetical protein